MRGLAIVLNVVLIGTVIYLVSTSDKPSGKDLALAALFIGAPLVSLLAFYFSGGENWLSLYLKRKALEEKAKIARLNETKHP